MGYVYGFDHEHPRPPMELKDLLGGRCQPGRMTSVLGLPVHTASRSRQTPVVRTCQRGGPSDLMLRSPSTRKARGSHGTPSRRPGRTLLVSVRSGAKFSMPA